MRGTRLARTAPSTCDLEIHQQSKNPLRAERDRAEAGAAPQVGRSSRRQRPVFRSASVTSSRRTTSSSISRRRIRARDRQSPDGDSTDRDRTDRSGAEREAATGHRTGRERAERTCASACVSHFAPADLLGCFHGWGRSARHAARASMLNQDRTAVDALKGERGWKTSPPGRRLRPAACRKPRARLPKRGDPMRPPAGAGGRRARAHLPRLA